MLLINVEIQPEKIKWVREAEVDGEDGEITADAVAVRVLVVVEIRNLARSK